MASSRPFLLVLLVFLALAGTTSHALSVRRTLPAAPIRPCELRPPAAGARRASPLRARAASDELLSLLSGDVGGATPDEESIQREIGRLEASFRSSDNATEEAGNDPHRFEPLVGLYKVASVLTKDKRDNPVGGKWTRKNGLAQRLFRTRATFQHLLPFNATGLCRADETVAEAVNVVSLDALDGRLRITVVLRGDATPLSSGELLRLNANRTLTPLTNLAVRAHFDPPRVFFGKRRKGRDYSYLALKLGPTSSVVLDTTYYDDALRIGMGGTSGTRFVFTTTARQEAREYEALLSQPSSGNRRKVLTRLCGLMIASLCMVFGSHAGAGKLGSRAVELASARFDANIAASALGLVKSWKPWVLNVFRAIAGATSVLSGIVIALILFSSGGIERDGVAMQGSSSSAPR